MSSDYHPSKEVRDSNNIPRLNKDLQMSREPLSVSVDYITSILVFPAIILIITIALCVFYLMALCVRFISRNCCCGGRKRSEYEELLQVKHRVIAGRLFVFLNLSAIAIDCFLFLGNSQLTSAFYDFSDSVNALLELLEALVSNILLVSRHVSLFLTTATSSTCIPYQPDIVASGVTYTLSMMESATDSLSSLTDTIFSNLRSVRDDLRSSYIDTKDLVRACCLEPVWS